MEKVLKDPSLLNRVHELLTFASVDVGEACSLAMAFETTDAEGNGVRRELKVHPGIMQAISDRESHGRSAVRAAMGMGKTEGEEAASKEEEEHEVGQQESTTMDDKGHYTIVTEIFLRTAPPSTDIAKRALQDRKSLLDRVVDAIIDSWGIYIPQKPTDAPSSPSSTTPEWVKGEPSFALCSLVPKLTLSLNRSLHSHLDLGRRQSSFPQ